MGESGWSQAEVPGPEGKTDAIVITFPHWSLTSPHTFSLNRPSAEDPSAKKNLKLEKKYTAIKKREEQCAITFNLTATSFLGSLLF